MRKHTTRIGLHPPESGSPGMAIVATCDRCPWQDVFAVSQETLVPSANGAWVPTEEAQAVALQNARRAGARHESTTNGADTAVAVNARTAKVDKVIGVVAVALIFVSGYLASAGYTSESTSRRGRSMEEYFSGFAVIFGSHEEYQSGAAAIGRVVMVLALVAAGAYVGRKITRKAGQHGAA